MGIVHEETVIKIKEKLDNLMFENADEAGLESAKQILEGTLKDQGYYVNGMEFKYEYSGPYNNLLITPVSDSAKLFMIDAGEQAILIGLEQ